MHLRVAVAHVRDIVDAVQVLVPVIVVQVAARAAHDVQRCVVIDRLRGAPAVLSVCNGSAPCTWWMSAANLPTCAT